jgi:sulfate permease, SulP family
MTPKNIGKTNRSDVNETFTFIKKFLIDGLKEINPWQNIKIMHTNVGKDILSGIVVAIIALPLALAFGVGSGLGAITGIWGAIAGGIIGGLFGGSRFGVSGPTGPKMAQLAAIMVGFRLASGEPDLSAAFAIIFLSGLILIGISFLKISRIIHYTPYSVVAGFMCGIGVIVMLLELDSFLGLPVPHSVFDAIQGIPYAFSHASLQALLVSVPTLAVMFIWPKVIKKYRRLKLIPGPLLGLIVGTGIAQFGGFQIEYIGDIPSGLPELYFPDFSNIGAYWIPALSLAGLAVFDSLLTCVVADQLTGDKHSSDRETFGQGVANCAAGLVGGLTTATATMRTVANIKSGGKTPLASVVHGVILLALVLGMGPMASGIPMACLAAILFKVGIDILDYRILPVLFRLPLTDMIVFWSVLIVTVVEDLLVGMGIGFLLAIIRFVMEVSKTYKPSVTDLGSVDSSKISKELKDKIKVLKPAGPMFFGSVQSLETAYHQTNNCPIILIDLDEVTMLDISGAYALEDLVAKAKSENRIVYVANANPKVKDVLERVKVIESFGKGGYFDLAEDALTEAEKLQITDLDIKNIGSLGKMPST